MRAMGKGALVLVIMMAITTMYSNGRCEFRRGDINGDGWCNHADVEALSCYLMNPGLYSLKCPDGADVNGDGLYGTIADLTNLINFLNGNVGLPNATTCDDPTAYCEANCQSAIIYMGAPTYTATTATIPVFINATTMPVMCLNFSLEYSYSKVSSISVTDGLVWNRVAACSLNGLAAITWLSSNSCAGQSFATPTQIMTITVNKQTGADTAKFNLCISTEDTIEGPARVYFGLESGYPGTLCSQPSSPLLIAGDANGDYNVLGNDVTYLTNYFRGIGPAPVARYGNCVALKW